jgi:Skp family chaperone for outer membrane proteins
MKRVLRVVEELKESNRELKAENLRVVEELKESNRELKAENEALRKEIGEMRVELKALAKPGLSQAWQAAPSSLRTLFLGT